MNDLRALLSECPLGYEVPFIPASHTALVIETDAADIDWQEKMLPWTLASLIDNTDLIMTGVHLYITCENSTKDRIETALKRFDLPPGTLIPKATDNKPLMRFGKYGSRYDSICMFDINYWAFRGIGKSYKLPLGHILRHTYGWAAADYSLHPAHDIHLKDAWLQMFESSSSEEEKQQKRLARSLSERAEHIANYFMDVEDRKRWLHEANQAVYGEDYKARNKSVAAYFLNETEPNWHLDASILQYEARDVNDPYFADWASEWQHLGTEALIALWLLKTQQHASNLSDSVMIHPSYARNKRPRLCNMQLVFDREQFVHATRELVGDHLNITMNSEE